MKLINLFLILFLAIPFAYADDVLIRTNVTVNAVSWYDINTNISKMNITIFTENIEGEKNLVINEVSTTFNSNKYITFTRSLSCANTTLGRLDDYLTRCDGVDCKEKYFECKFSKEVVVGAKDTLDKSLATCNTEKIDFQNQADTNKNNYEYYYRNATSCQNDIATLQEETSSLISGWFVLFAFIIGIIGGEWVKQQLGIRNKTGGKGEEELHNVNYIPKEDFSNLPPK